jgi:long-chain acyl-CoA synthetase
MFSEIREFFGGRVKTMITGAAPLSKDVMDFFKVAFSV